MFVVGLAGVDSTAESEMTNTFRDKRDSRPSHLGDVADGKRSPPLIAVGVLDAFSITVDDIDVQLPPSGQHLVGYLAVAGRSVPRRTLASQLWLDIEETRGLARLRNVVWKVSAIVPDLIISREQDVRLRPSARIDLAEARETATRVIATNGSQPPSIRRSVLEHDLLPDWDVEWLVVERPAFKVLRVRALEIIARRRLEDSRHDEAELACRLVIAAEPFRESARLLLAEVCIAQGNVGLALCELNHFDHVLRHELGIAPNHEIQEMIATIHASG